MNARVAVRSGSVVAVSCGDTEATAVIVGARGSCSTKGSGAAARSGSPGSVTPNTATHAPIPASTTILRVRGATGSHRRLGGPFNASGGRRHQARPSGGGAGAIPPPTIDWS